MVNGLYYLWCQIDQRIEKSIIKVAFKTESDPSHTFNFISFTKKVYQLANEIVNTWGILSNHHNVGPNIFRVKVLGSSWTCSEELFLSLYALPSSKHAVLYDKSTRFNQSFREQESFILMHTILGGNERTGECFDILNLEIDDKVVDFFKRAYNPSHHVDFNQ